MKLYAITALFLIALLLTGCVSTGTETTASTYNQINSTQTQEQPTAPQPVPSAIQVPAPAVQPAPAPNPASTQPAAEGSRPGFLQNIGVNIADYNSATNKAGDFEFIDTIDHYGHKIFLEYGIELCGPESCGSLPSYNYFLPLGTVIFSPVKGTVERVASQGESGDYEVVIAPEGYPQWRLSFDHVANVRVREGQQLQPNDAIGTPAPRGSVDSRLGFVELQVWGGTAAPRTVCPFLLLNNSVKLGIEQKIRQLATDWEAYLSRDVHDESKWIAPGCLVEEADG